LKALDPLQSAWDLSELQTFIDPQRLVELVGDDCVLNEEFEGNDLQGVLVGGFEDDGAGSAGLLNLKPARRADAPAVAWLQTSEAELRHGGAEIVAERLGGSQEGLVDQAADRVDTVVFGAGLAAAGTVEAGHGFAATDIEGLAKNIFAAVFDGFYGGHRPIVEPATIDRG
jgi:hypothetical protein